MNTESKCEFIRLLFSKLWYIFDFYTKYAKMLRIHLSPQKQMFVLRRMIYFYVCDRLVTYSPCLTERTS